MRWDRVVTQYGTWDSGVFAKNYYFGGISMTDAERVLSMCTLIHGDLQVGIVGYGKFQVYLTEH
jgi:hypothetical protein